VKRLQLTEIARADLKSIRRYSQHKWGPERTKRYMSQLKQAMKGLLKGTVIGRERSDVRPGLRMASSGRHCIFFEADPSRVLIVRVLHDRMDHQRHLEFEDPSAD
jgi:toxin ParE1/3/4